MIKKLIVVVGPTAVGKTALCIKLAKQLNTEIINADSRQIYKEISIGTAKPSMEEMDGIIHHFVDSHTISEAYNAGEYERDVLSLLEKLFIKHDVVILTGGSGMYIKAVCEGLDKMPDTDLDIRQQLNDRAANGELETLVEELKGLDPIYHAEVDPANTQRVIRGLEVCLSTEKPFSSFRKNEKEVRPFEIVKIGLEREREELYDRINRRMDIMLDAGLLEEAKAVFQFKAHNALQTVGYREIFDFLEDKHDWEECVRLLKRNSRRYAKRQLTWFGKDKEIHWFSPSDFDSIMEYLEKNA